MNSGMQAFGTRRHRIVQVLVSAQRGEGEKNKQTRIKHLQHSFNHDEELKTSVKRAPKKEKFPVVGSDTQKTRETK